ncbi:MAG: hypothetical protein P4M14_10315 [Gammaproteobacteria bacterium]|nr:hypothetical protein [Gammaproteobacteria bacterium]
MSFGRFFCCMPKNNKVSSRETSYEVKQSPLSTTKPDLAPDEATHSALGTNSLQLQNQQRKESNSSSSQHQAAKTVFYRFPPANITGNHQVVMNDLRISLTKFFDGETTTSNQIIPGCSTIGIPRCDLITKEAMMVSTCMESNSYYAFLEFDISKSTSDKDCIRFTLGDLVAIRDFDGNVICENETVINGEYLMQSEVKANGFFNLGR